MKDRSARRAASLRDLTPRGHPQNEHASDLLPSAELPEDAAILRDRLIAAFEMFELGVEMMAANLRWRHPQAPPEEIERLLDAWLLERPGAELGDGPGTPVPLERFR